LQQAHRQKHFVVRQAHCKMGQVMSQGEAPPPVVLVPPLFERDLRLRTRMAHSSYDYMFGKPAMRFLMNDYLQGTRGWLNFRPAEDQRVSVAAVLDAPNTKGLQGTGVVTLRYQPDPEDYSNFVDIKAQAGSGGMAKARGCFFDASSGFGAWASVPLVHSAGSTSVGPEANGVVGLRYGSAVFTSGLLLSPTNQMLEQLWMGGRQGALSYGLQSTPRYKLSNLNGTAGLQSLAEACQERMSYCIAYSPLSTSTPPGRGTFTAAVEVRDQRQMCISFLYHLALQRNIRNPLEGADVVAITNYVDVGLEVATDYATANGDTPPANGAALAVAWQANRGLLVKGKVSTEGVSAAMAVKAWANPSWTAAASAAWLFDSNTPKLGLTFGVENHGTIRYERSKDRTQRGSSVVQRHVAMQDEVDIAEGKGRLVLPEQLDDPGILGQTQARADHVL
jgi:hypothetical protein